MDDDAIRVLLKRLARPHPSGGTVVERAAVVAEGTGSQEVLDWMSAHGAVAEEAVVPAPRGGGLHGMDRRATGSQTAPPSRYILPADALS